MGASESRFIPPNYGAIVSRRPGRIGKRVRDAVDIYPPSRRSWLWGKAERPALLCRRLRLGPWRDTEASAPLPSCSRWP